MDWSHRRRRRPKYLRPGLWSRFWCSGLCCYWYWSSSWSCKRSFRFWLCPWWLPHRASWWTRRQFRWRKSRARLSTAWAARWVSSRRLSASARSSARSWSTAVVPSRWPTTWCGSLVSRKRRGRCCWQGSSFRSPCFLDVALVILAPLLFALARDTKRPFLHFGLPLVAGMAVTHAFVPPTPGPVAVGYLLGVNLGWVILFGVLVGFPTAIICGPWLCVLLSKTIDHKIIENDPVDPVEEADLPSFGFITFLIVMPIAMILANTIVEQWVASGLPEGLTTDERKAQLTDLLANGNALVQTLTFLGHPVIALLFATVAALYFLGTRRGVDRETLLEISTKALGPAGIIILITGAGGVFKGVLKATGITDALEIMFAESGISVLVLAWVFATLIRIAQGSATVAMLTAAGLMANFVADLNQPQLGLITIAIASGATGFSHVNDSGFWMISRYFQMSEAQTLKTWGVISTLISIIGFGIAMLLWQFIG